jgi:hypothetical protein
VKSVVYFWFILAPTLKHEYAIIKKKPTLSKDATKTGNGGKMNILIIGGTTFFGQDIVELALAAGHSVTLFSRGNQQPEFWDRITHIAGDRNDQADFAGN